MPASTAGRFQVLSSWGGLPTLPGAELAMPGPHDFNSPRFGRVPTILLADDELTPRAEAARLPRLRGVGRPPPFRVFRRHPGKIRLVVTDFIMPLMDGGELAERIRDAH